MRQLPQEQFLEANAQANKNFERIENQLGRQEQEIQTGLGKDRPLCRLSELTAAITRWGPAALLQAAQGVIDTLD